MIYSWDSYVGYDVDRLLQFVAFIVVQLLRSVRLFGCRPRTGRQAL